MSNEREQELRDSQWSGKLRWDGKKNGIKEGRNKHKGSKIMSQKNYREIDMTSLED